MYEKKRKECRGKQVELECKLSNLRNADEEYYITSSYLLNLASRAGELFKSSEPKEKRMLLQLTLQNLQLNGAKVQYDLVKPFDIIASHSSRNEWLRGLD